VHLDWHDSPGTRLAEAQYLALLPSLYFSFIRGTLERIKKKTCESRSTENTSSDPYKSGHRRRRICRRAVRQDLAQKSVPVRV
jgi:hypothetical protein